MMWEWPNFGVRLTYHSQGNAHGKPEWADDQTEQEEAPCRGGGYGGHTRGGGGGGGYGGHTWGGGGGKWSHGGGGVWWSHTGGGGKWLHRGGGKWSMTVSCSDKVVTHSALCCWAGWVGLAR